MFPAESLLAAQRELKIDTAEDPEAFRTAVAEHFHSKPAEFEFRVQLCTNLDSMPAEDASKEWPEEESAYRLVGQIFLPSQASDAPERRTYFDEALSFQPANSLAAHRPLGQIMRARLFVYGRLSDFRHAANGVPSAEPRSLADVAAAQPRTMADTPI